MRIKEEKEALEHFAGVFTMMSPSTFREIFSATINYVVERIYNNYTLQVGEIAKTKICNKKKLGITAYFSRLFSF